MIACLFLSKTGFAQLSPGDLAEAHAHLEGLSNCTQCHVLNQKVSNDKCLACHKLLSDRIKSEQGYHASPVIAGKDCISCHSDHHGRKFDMIRFDTINFDHQMTGYVLEGAHEKVNCSQCHRDIHIPDPEVRKLKSTYLGLQKECLNCHDDYHKQTLAANCLQCHTYASFKEIPNFNHSNSSFPLKGRHQEVACEKCHRIADDDGTTTMVYKGLAFGSCTDCHRDVHDNKFGQDCERCHTEQSFHQVIGLTTFDHGKTGYRLEGRHQFVSCEKCHTWGYSTPLPHEKCMECHDDFHESQFARDGQLPDCAKCHTVQGFSPSLFTVDKHQQANFPLEGAHLAIPCISCHLKSEKWQFRDIGIRCVDCHEDIHQPYLPGKYYPDQNCKSCHALESWNQIGFDHKQTNYPLIGAHKGPSCRACHDSESNSVKNSLRFTGVSTKCVNCHDDKHAGQFEENGETRCANCHESIDWKAHLFDHNKSRFVLDGQHSQVSCAACHKPATINGVITIQYKFEDIRCESCH